uniref:Uncharacterized protein n=1 Tax=Triticum urartu TaxID=4572 RepID=A0A8R7V515_TRIUA
MFNMQLFFKFLISWASGSLFEGRFSADRVSSVKRGVFVMIAVFLAYSFAQAPSTSFGGGDPYDGNLLRPFQFWRWCCSYDGRHVCLP